MKKIKENESLAATPIGKCYGGLHTWIKCIIRHHIFRISIGHENNIQQSFKAPLALHITKDENGG